MYSQRDFFHTVLGSEGKPCVAKLVKGSSKAYFTHDFFNSIDDLCDVLDTIDFTKHDYYFCISTLTGEKDSSGRIRTQANAVTTRAFVLDVDIRPGQEGHYATKEEGYKGIAAVCEQLSLPDPIIVDSGFGLHVYWPMADAVPSKDWQKIANKLKKAIGVIAPEVVADGSRVADTAGVLRIPNSFNLKGGKTTPVEIKQWYSDYVDFGRLRDLLIGLVPDKNEKSKFVATAPINDSKPGELVRVAKNCNWIGTYLKNSAEASEPEWYAVLGLVPYLVHTKEGQEITDAPLAHLISKKHPQYDAEATYKKYMQAKNGQTGPTTCARFQSINSSRCEGCPFAASVKTPIGTSDLSKPSVKETVVTTEVKDDEGNTSTETVTIPIPPKPYFRGQDGGIFVRQKQQKEDKSWEEIITKVYDYDFYPVRRFRTESLESEYMEMHLWLPKDGLRKFKLPNGMLADGKTLGKFLSDRGVVPEFGKLGMVAKYLIEYVRDLQMNHSAEVEFSRFGWREVHSTEPKFVVGDGFLAKDGELHPSTHADFLKQAADAVSQKGNLAKWKEAYGVYNSIPHSEPFILASLIGFAAPLLALTPYNGVVYNMVGSSSAGKSTAMQVMTSVFGQPRETHILKNDTEISRFNFIGYLNNIPVAFDELTNMEPEHLSNFCLNFTTGRGKMRANQHGQNKVNETEWDTIVCASSNTSLYDKLASFRKGYNAEAMRIFEISVGESDARFKQHVDDHLKLLKENYGLAGREFIRYVLPRIITIKEAIEKATNYVTTRGKLRNEERFWGALLACVLIGGKISRDILRLHTYNVEGVVDWALGMSEEVRHQVKIVTSDPISTVAEFFNSNLNAILRMENGKPALGGMQGNLSSVKVRLELEDGTPARAFISTPAIREYCIQRRIDPSWLRKELLTNNIIKDSGQMRLTAGSGLPGVSGRVWEMDMRHPMLEGLDIPTPPSVEEVSGITIG